ncbi:MAG: hypothetical protein ABWY25_06610 [Paenisporosarcina sp.]
MIAVKKARDAEDYIHHIYIHMNEADQFVIFNGLTLEQFVQSSGPMQHLLLLKHQYEDGSFNMHTQLEFVPADEIRSFLKEFVDAPTDLRWIDFEEERKLNALTPQEQAELLYIGHKKEAIRSPFYYQLQNRFVYLANEEENMTKIYFRELADSEDLVVNVMNQYVKDKEKGSAFWKRKTKQSFPVMTIEQFKALRPLLKEGVLLSLYKQEKPKSLYEVEVRLLPDNVYPDEIWDELTSILLESPDETIRFLLQSLA